MNDPDNLWQQASRFGALGIEMAIAVVLGCLLGQAVDDRYHTAPYGVLFGFIIGTGAAILGMVRLMRVAQRTLSATTKEPSSPPPPERRRSQKPRHDN